MKFSDIIGAIYPKRCISCGEIIPENEWLCNCCHSMAEVFDSSKRCTACGLEKKHCDCKRIVFHFAACIAPFYNSGVIKKAFYAYKLGRKRHYSVFFADRMALCVKNEYRSVRFDGVCYVPASRRSKLKRGFDQCEVLASRIADRLELPLMKNEIVCTAASTSQHSLSMWDRFDNVRGKYKCKSDNTGKKLLLIDDIKTTGSTLDECARVLMFSGAYEVYCVTALITDNKGKESKNGNRNRN